MKELAHYVCEVISRFSIEPDTSVDYDTIRDLSRMYYDCIAQQTIATSKTERAIRHRHFNATAHTQFDDVLYVSVCVAEPESRDSIHVSLYRNELTPTSSYLCKHRMWILSQGDAL